MLTISHESKRQFITNVFSITSYITNLIALRQLLYLSRSNVFINYKLHLLLDIKRIKASPVTGHLRLYHISSFMSKSIQTLSQLLYLQTLSLFTLLVYIFTKDFSRLRSYIDLLAIQIKKSSIITDTPRPRLLILYNSHSVRTKPTEEGIY